jgi:hypothetical protein
MAAWFEYAAERNAFARVLVESGQVSDTEDVLYFYEKPHKWDEEYDLWVRFGRPTVDDEVVWNSFLNELDKEITEEE